MELITFFVIVLVIPFLIGILVGYFTPDWTDYPRTLSYIFIIGGFSALVLQIIAYLSIGFYLSPEAYLIGATEFIAGVIGSLIVTIILVYTFFFGILFTIGAFIGDLIEKTV